MQHKKQKLRSLYHITTIIIVSSAILTAGGLSSCQYFLQPSIKTDEIYLRGTPAFDSEGSAMVYMDKSDNIICYYNVNTDQKMLLPFSRPVYNPKLSPDGKTLFYTQLSEYGYYSELWIKNLATGKNCRLTDFDIGDIYTYAICPDGSSLVCTAFNDSENRQSIYRLTAHQDISEAHRITGNLPNLTIDDYIQPSFISDNRVLFALNTKIYIIDTANYQLIKTIDVKRPVHFMSAISPYAVFVSLKDCYYQIFLINLDTEVLKQATWDASNKLIPVLSKDGYLYYIEDSDELNLRNLSYLQWLTCRNSTSVFKDYRNDWGRIAWGESHALEFLITGYKAFNDTYLLEEFCIHANSVLNNMDIFLGIEDYLGESTYGWSATRYSFDKKSRLRSLTHEGMIGVPLAEFIKIDDSQGFSDSSMQKLAKRSLETLRYLAKQHDREWIEHDFDDLDVTNIGEGYYISPKGSPSKQDGINLPFNQQNKFGTLLLLLYEQNGDTEYLDKAVKMGRIFKRHLIQDGNGYNWHYWWGKGLTGYNEDEGISTHSPSYKGDANLDSRGYATIEIEFVTHLNKYDVFNDDDMNKFINTFLDQNSKMRFNTAKVGFLLSEYDKQIVDKIGIIDILGEPWQYIPHLGLVNSYNSEMTWKLKKINMSATEPPVTEYESCSVLHYFLLGSGSKVAIIYKDTNAPFAIKIADTIVKH